LIGVSIACYRPVFVQTVAVNNGLPQCCAAVHQYRYRVSRQKSWTKVNSSKAFPAILDFEISFQKCWWAGFFLQGLLMLRFYASCSASLSLSHIIYLYPSTRIRYTELHCKPRGIELATVKLSTVDGGVLAHLIRRPDAEAIVLYLYGGGHT
jgi:hypothetical protein